MKRELRALGVVAAMVVAATAVNAAPPDYPSMNLKMAHFVPATAAQANWDKWWADQVETRSGGKIKIQIFWAGSLGNTNEMHQMLSDGAIDFAVFPATYKPAELPLTGVGGAVPRLFPDAEAASQQTKALYALPSVQAEWAKAGIEPLFSHSSNPYHIQCTHPIRTMADLEGVKIRSAGSYHPRLWQAVGAVPVNISLGEVYEALQRGNVGCGWMSIDQVYAAKTYEVAKYAIDLNTGALATWQVYVNRNKFYKQWPAPVRELMRKIATEAAAHDLTSVQADGKKAEAQLRSKGVKFIEFQDKPLFAKKAPDLLRAWADDLRSRGLENAANAVAETIRRGPGM